MALVSEPNTPLTTALPGRVRRASAAGRATAAVAAESFPLSLSPSPLVRPRSPPKHALPLVRRFQFSKPSTPASALQQEGDSDKMTALCQELELPDVPVVINLILKLNSAMLTHILSFVGDSPRSFRVVNSVCRRWRVGSFPCITDVTLVPECSDPEKLSAVGTFSSIRDYFSVHTRGQHLRKLTIMKSRTVYDLPHTFFGPTVGSQSLSALLMNLPQLQCVDVRGIQLRDFAPWCDHFLTDLAQHCPNLESLACGPQYIRSWEPQWWTPLTQLNRFVIGSRREDNDWNQPSTPVVLHEDFFTMLKTHTQLQTLKIWCALATPSFVQLALHPTGPYLALTTLSLNAMGNTHLRPLDDFSTPEGAGGAHLLPKKEAKPSAKKGVFVEDAPSSKSFPCLHTLTVADVKDRPDFAAELIVKLTTTAPGLVTMSVVNTHRTGPGKVQAPVPGAPRVRGGAAAAH